MKRRKEIQGLFENKKGFLITCVYPRLSAVKIIFLKKDVARLQSR